MGTEEISALCYQSSREDMDDSFIQLTHHCRCWTDNIVDSGGIKACKK